MCISLSLSFSLSLSLHMYVYIYIYTHKLREESSKGNGLRLSAEIYGSKRYTHMKLALFSQTSPKVSENLRELLGECNLESCTPVPSYKCPIGPIPDDSVFLAASRAGAGRRVRSMLALERGIPVR